MTVEKTSRHNRFRSHNAPRRRLGQRVEQDTRRASRASDPITRFDASGHDTKIAAEVKGFNAEEYIAPKELKRMDLFVQYALAATKIAVEDAGLDMATEDAERVGVIVGTGLGGLPTLEKYHSILLERGPSQDFSLLHPHADRERSPRQHRDPVRDEGTQCRTPRDSVTAKPCITTCAVSATKPRAS